MRAYTFTVSRYASPCTHAAVMDVADVVVIVVGSATISCRSLSLLRVEQQQCTFG